MYDESVTAYPLTWPSGWKRTASKSYSRYADHSLAKARDKTFNEVRMLGGKDVIISSNLALRVDGMPKGGQSQPFDNGVAVYFKYKSQSMCFACDKWSRVEDNLWAIGKTIEAVRQIERTGSSDMMARAFTGFTALPAPEPKPSWWEVLGTPRIATKDEIRRAYRENAKLLHPDNGGNPELFRQLQAAYEEGMANF